MDTDTIDPDMMGIFLEHEGFSDEAIDDFLEHFGVRGQKWGVRRQSRLDLKSAKISARLDYLTSKRDQLDRKSAGISARRDGGGTSKAKTVGKIAGGVAIAAGAIFAAKYFKGSGKSFPIKQVGQFVSVGATGAGLAKTLMSMRGQQPYNQMREEGDQ